MTKVSGHPGAPWMGSIAGVAWASIFPEGGVHTSSGVPALSVGSLPGLLSAALLLLVPPVNGLSLALWGLYPKCHHVLCPSISFVKYPSHFSCVCWLKCKSGQRQEAHPRPRSAWPEKLIFSACTCSLKHFGFSREQNVGIGWAIWSVYFQGLCEKTKLSLWEVVVLRGSDQGSSISDTSILCVCVCGVLQ